LAAVKALQEEFKTELATLKGRVDGLEARTKTLEAQQFSTTTKLQGEVVMAVQYGDVTGTRKSRVPVRGPRDVATNFGTPANPLSSRATALARVRLNFNTSFTGSDLLQTQLEVGNGGNDLFSNLSGFGDAGFAGTPNPGPGGRPNLGVYDVGAADYSGVGSTVTLRRLAYSFKPMKGLTVTVGPRIFPSDFVDFNSYANNSAQDFSSGVFINNPLIINNVVDTLGGAGAAVDYKFGDSGITARAVYVAASPTNSVANFTGGGLFGDPYQGTAEIEYAKTFGADKKNNFAVRGQFTNSSTNDIHQNVVGLNGELTFGRFGFFGRAGYSIEPSFGKAPLIPGKNGILTWQAGVGVKDLFIPGSLLAAAIGQPYVVFKEAGPEQTNFEGFYRFPINDNITITPAVMVITDVGNTRTNTAVQGVVRATFSF
jgi:Carbohydrate-selective porin, OprB family